MARRARARRPVRWQPRGIRPTGRPRPGCAPALPACQSLWAGEQAAGSAKERSPPAAAAACRWAAPAAPHCQRARRRGHSVEARIGRCLGPGAPAPARGWCAISEHPYTHPVRSSVASLVVRGGHGSHGRVTRQEMPYVHSTRIIMGFERPLSVLFVVVSRKGVALSARAQLWSCS